MRMFLKDELFYVLNVGQSLSTYGTSALGEKSTSKKMENTALTSQEFTL